MLSAVHILDVNVPYSISCEVGTAFDGANICTLFINSSILPKVKKGYPNPSVSWTRNGMDSIITEGPILEFNDPQAENQGTYCVQVTKK